MTPLARPASAAIQILRLPRKLPRIHQISRQELYNLIWSTPITALAERFGLPSIGYTRPTPRVPPRLHNSSSRSGSTASAV
jgi:hypothetical protein